MEHKPKSGDTTEANYKVRTIRRLRDKHIEIERWVLNQAGIEFEAFNNESRLSIVI